MERLVAFARARQQLLARCAAITESERIGVGQAAGRRLAETCTAPKAYPAQALAAMDGLAVRSADSIGASPYNPLPAGLGASVEPGGALPAGADAVASWESVMAAGGTWTLLDEIDAGQGVCRVGQLLAAGAPVVQAERVLSSADVTLLAALDRREVTVDRRPMVGVIEVGAGAQTAVALVRSQLMTEGAAIEHGSAADADALGRALSEAAARVDLILVVGGTGEGPSGIVPAVVEQAGVLDAHGLALRPGRATGVGAVADRPVVLVPPEPLAAQAAGELVAGPALRALAGAEDRPHRTWAAPLARKAVSALGEVTYMRAAAEDERIHPQPSGTDLDLPVLGRTDGFILIGADSEGHAAGTEVTLYLDRC